ncbi:MAG: hypothetical protein A4E58_01762 [Syntrophorhabdus sp. PtaB.Bin006]|nr:MAG: hypothetical protein A4E58_01762 [Syntrophorhabdus sp. PtaB.Bin006]
MEEARNACSTTFERTGRSLPCFLFLPESVVFNCVETCLYVRGSYHGNTYAVLVVPGQGVLQAKAEGVHGKPVGKAINDLFHGGRYLGHTKAAKGAAKAVVCVDRTTVDGCMGDAVRSPCMLYPEGHDLAGEVRVGTALKEEAAGKGRHRAVRLCAEAILHRGGQALHACKKAFFAVPPHLDRSIVRAEGSKGEEGLDRDTVFAAEGPAQMGSDDPDLLRIKTQSVAHFKTVTEGRLG